MQDDVEAYVNGFATQAEGASQIKLVKLLFLRHRRLSFELVLLVSMVFLYLTQNYYKLQFAQIESETASSYAEEIFERKVKNQDEASKILKAMALLQPEAKEKLTSYIDGNDLPKALTLANQYIKISNDSYFHLKKAEILTKLARPRSALQALKRAQSIFPNDTKISEMIDSISP